MMNESVNKLSRRKMYSCDKKLPFRKICFSGAEKLSVTRWGHFLIAFVFLITQCKWQANHANWLWSKAIDYHHCYFMNLGLNSFPYGNLISLELHLLWLYPVISFFFKNFRCPYLVLLIWGTQPFSGSNLN